MTHADWKTGTDGIMIDGIMLDLNDTRRLEDWDRWYHDKSVLCWISMTHADWKTGTDGIMIDGIMLDLNDARRPEDWNRWCYTRSQ